MAKINFPIVENIHRWDVYTFLQFNRWLNQSGWGDAARLLSKTGDGWLYFVIPIATMLVSLELGTHLFVVTAAAFAVERTFYFIMKKSFKRRRPPQAIPGFKASIIASDEFSFPSGHTSGAFLMATLCFVHLSPLMALGYLWAASIGACRVILGVHFPTDTFMGAFIGTSVALFMSTFFPPII